MRDINLNFAQIYPESDFQEHLPIKVDSKDFDFKDLIKSRREEGDNNGGGGTIVPLEDDAQCNAVGDAGDAVTDAGDAFENAYLPQSKRKGVSLPKYWRKASFKRLLIKSKCEASDKDNNDWSDQHISLQQQLALTALNLTVPASTMVNKHRNTWIQLSGHPGSLAPAGPGTIWKKQPTGSNEAVVYEALMKDSAKGIVPCFYRHICYNGENFIEIGDLLSNFDNPSVMDIKIGCRTFLEDEVLNTKARGDLYHKMVKLDPCAPTEDEHDNEAVTKLRYMEFRDRMTSSQSLGFRIEALKMSNNSSVTELKSVRSKEEVLDVLRSFVRKNDWARKALLARLKHIRKTFENSEFFRQREVIGSSILFIYDDHHKANAWMIDFAKTMTLPEDVKVDHKSQWKLGNHEEGYLIGISNLIKCFEELNGPTKKIMNFFNK